MTEEAIAVQAVENESVAEKFIGRVATTAQVAGDGLADLYELVRHVLDMACVAVGKLFWPTLVISICFISGALLCAVQAMITEEGWRWWSVPWAAGGIVGALSALGLCALTRKALTVFDCVDKLYDALQKAPIEARVHLKKASEIRGGRMYRYAHSAYALARTLLSLRDTVDAGLNLKQAGLGLVLLSNPLYWVVLVAGVILSALYLTATLLILVLGLAL